MTRPAVGSTLARRLLLFLALLAPVPVALLLTAAIDQYERRIEVESDRRLAALAKGAGHELHGRLKNLEADLDVLDAGGGEPRLVAAMSDRFRAVAESPLAPGSAPEGAVGVAPLAADDVERLGSGRSVLRIGTGADSRVRLWLARAAATRPGTATWAELVPSRLWPEEGLPDETGLQWLLLALPGSRLVAHPPATAGELLLAARGLGGEASGAFHWRDADGRRHRARYWTVPLGYEFGSPGLVALVSEPDALAPALTRLRRTLLLIGVGSVLLVALLTLRRLRIEFEPLSALIRAHNRLADGDLSARVAVAGSADLERLGGAFNETAEQLQRQFHLLDAGQEVASAALALRAEEGDVARAFAARVARLVPGAELIVTLTDRDGVLRRILPEPSDAPRLDGAAGEDRRTSRLPESVLGGPGWSSVEAASWLPERLWGRKSLWRALRREDRVLGAVGILVDADSDLLGIDLELLRGPSEQLALALSHLRSLGELERASLGALTALARAVDAKSSWTRGHAERVAEIAVAIAEELGWTEPALGVVRRGALLHDVGKIGVPVAVLDKPDRLTAEEVALLRTHVEKGARILEPIEAFADLLPILWQHHERLDGSGYPLGLEGDQIDPAASVVAVADVFEALTAERPYRGAQDPDATLAYLVARAGGEFDPRAVAALERVRSRSVRWPFPLRDLRARSVG